MSFDHPFVSGHRLLHINDNYRSGFRVDPDGASSIDRDIYLISFQGQGLNFGIFRRSGNMFRTSYINKPRGIFNPEREGVAVFHWDGDRGMPLGILYNRGITSGKAIRMISRISPGKAGGNNIGRIGTRYRVRTHTAQ